MPGPCSPPCLPLPDTTYTKADVQESSFTREASFSKERLTKDLGDAGFLFLDAG